MNEYHLFVIWEKARYQLEKILADIDEHFAILRQYDISWSKDKVADNFSKFYGAKLADVEEKVRLCGGGCFRVVVVCDNHPIYDKRDTSRGVEVVNVNMFDAKTKYRQWTDGGHQIHATNSSEEMSHDLLMLTGENVEVFKQHPVENNDIISLQRDVLGVEPWENIEQVFRALNVSFPYVMLRGQQQIWNGYFPEQHRDIDILIHNRYYDQVVALVGGKPDCNPDRPHQRIEINGETYYIDIWRTEHYYFDPKWEMIMLKNRCLQNGLMVLSKEDNYYALLYHCVVVKGFISDDYALELRKYTGEDLSNKDAALKLLEFLKLNHYEIVYPTHDDSITIHLDNPDLHQYAMRFGEYVKGGVLSEGDIEVVCKVFKKANSYIKVGSFWLIENEIKKLQLFKGNKRMPQILNKGTEGSESFIEISKVDGIDASCFFKNKTNFTPRIIKRFVMGVIDILADFNVQRLMHRDFIPQNILVSDQGEVHVIDFGWAISYDEIDHCYLPKYLAHTDEGIYQAEDGSCDYYAFGKFIQLLSRGKIRYLNQLALVALSLCNADYRDEQRILECQNRLDALAKSYISIRDRFELFLFRHKTIAKYYHKFVNKIKSVL